MNDSPGLLSSKQSRSYGTTEKSVPGPATMNNECDNLGFDGERAKVQKNKSPGKTKYDEGKYF